MSNIFELMENKLVTLPDHYPQTEETKTTVKVLDTYVNLNWLLNKFKAVIRHNAMKNEWDINIPDHFIYQGDADNSALRLIDHFATLNGMPTKKLLQHVTSIAQRNSFHPIVDMREQNPWDNGSYVYPFIKTLVTANPKLTEEVVLTWLCSAMAAIYTEKGFVSHGVLVLQGPQGIGKTGWIKQLDPIGCDAVKEAAILDPSYKDDVMSALSYWIVELGELDSTFKKDIARIKAFITSSADHIRFPYGIKPALYRRKTVFAASVNSETYLVDETGNRRWWTIPVQSVRFNHGINMIQMWSEVYEIWKDGHPIELSKEVQQQMNELNRSFEKVDPIKEMLLTHYDWSHTVTRELTTTQVLQELGIKHITTKETTHCGKMIKELTGGKGRAVKGLWRHPVPPFLSR